MFNYEGTLYRPPSEAHSLIIQVTIGCAHNTCTFCSMYKKKTFRIRKEEEILAELDAAAASPYRDIPQLLSAVRYALECGYRRPFREYGDL